MRLFRRLPLLGGKRTPPLIVAMRLNDYPLRLRLPIPGLGPLRVLALVRVR